MIWILNIATDIPEVKVISYFLKFHHWVKIGLPPQNVDVAMDSAHIDGACPLSNDILATSAWDKFVATLLFYRVKLSLTWLVGIKNK